jgi:hypothetical protein
MLVAVVYTTVIMSTIVSNSCRMASIFECSPLSLHLFDSYLMGQPMWHNPVLILRRVAKTAGHQDHHSIHLSYSNSYFGLPTNNIIQNS